MKTVKDIEEAGRQVLMAGLGICGLGKDYAIHKVDSFMEDFNGFVNNLLIRGELVEEELHVNERVQAVKDRRIARIRKKLGLNSDSQTSELDNLSHKLDMLTKVVNKLAEQKAEKLAAENATDTVEKKTPVAKKAPVANKTPARRTTKTTTSARKTAAKSTSEVKEETKPAVKRTTRTTKTTRTASSRASTAKPDTRTTKSTTAKAATTVAKAEQESDKE